MRSPTPFAAACTLFVLTVAASGCTTHRSSQAGEQMSGMDMKTMCDRHTKMMREKTPQEHKMMMDEHMKSMSPDMRQKHMAMMEKCS